MHLGKIDVTHIGCVIVVLDLATGPVVTLDNEIVTGFNHCRHGNVRVPAIVNVVLIVGRFVKINFDNGFSHGSSLQTVVLFKGSLRLHR